MKMKAVLPALLPALFFAQGAHALDGNYVIQQLNSLMQVFGSLSTVVGIALAGIGIYMFYGRHKNPAQYPISRCIFTVLSGTLLITFSEAYSVLKASTIDPAGFAGGARNILAVDQNALNNLNQAGGAGILGRMMPANMALMVVGWCYIIGLGAFLRGLYLIKEIGNPQSQHGAGKTITHLLGGVFLMNLTESACILASIFTSRSLGLC